MTDTSLATRLFLLAAALAPLPAMAQGAPACTPVPVMATHTLPPYPEISVQLKESGTVTLEVTVARDGHVSGARVAQSSGFPRLDAAAADFVQQTYLWRPMACASAKLPLKVVWKLPFDGPR